MLYCDEVKNRLNKAHASKEEMLSRLIFFRCKTTDIRANDDTDNKIDILLIRLSIEMVEGAMNRLNHLF